MLERFGWNHHVHIFSICTTFPLALWSILRLFLSMKNVVIVAELGHAVVLLLGAVVPLPWSSSTVASGQELLLLR